MTNLDLKSDAAVVYVLRKAAKGCEVLLLRRNKGNALDNYWLTVVGGIELGETAWQTGIRELREETGLVPEGFYSANHFETYYSVHDDSLTMLPVFVAFVSFDAEVVLNEEHSVFRWFSVEEAARLAPFKNQKDNMRVVIETFIDQPPPDFLRIDVKT